MVGEQVEITKISVSAPKGSGEIGLWLEGNVSYKRGFIYR